MILEQIITQKKKEVADNKIKIPLKYLEREIVSREEKKFSKALLEPGMSLIAEVKKASPSKGVLKEDFDPVELAVSYERSGARAISVLTDNRFFQGSLEDLVKVKKGVKLSVLRKDFIIDPYQIYEACKAQADAVLLIAKILTEKELNDFLKIAEELKLDALVESHTREELEKALRCGAQIIGINNRDLTTFQTDIATTLKLAKFVPRDALLVSESGISSFQDVEKLAQVGVDAILVGEALVTSTEPGAKIGELLRGEPLNVD
ncbi:MAG: indole-3-glycerol phosphate synthase [Peptococcaceae bacterium BICA1-8]|nr:MAG: indole-3-glycerol phosphate synthase [Peptococcaceae bacterium BICA1-8]